jgi:hypothetical protein
MNFYLGIGTHQFHQAHTVYRACRAGNADDYSLHWMVPGKIDFLNIVKNFSLSTELAAHF